LPLWTNFPLKEGF